MPNERVSMSKLKQLIALQASNLSVRAIARGLGLSVGAVSKYLRAVRAAGIGPTEAETLPESELEQRVFGPSLPTKPPRLVPPDYPWVHTELKRHRHVTLQLLWEEYVERYGNAAYRRSAFCEGYRRWERRLKRLMRQRHFAGEKLFVDYAGRTVPIHGVHGEEAFRAQIFIGALGASGYAYAEAHAHAATAIKAAHLKVRFRSQVILTRMFRFPRAAQRPHPWCRHTGACSRNP